MAPVIKAETGIVSAPEAAPQTTGIPIHDQIAALAYALWQERGCPEGSPELDWFAAEARLTSTTTTEK